MRRLIGAELKTAIGWLGEAALVASGSSCIRAKCGAVIVSNEELLGFGCNSPPRNEAPGRCLKDDIKKECAVNGLAFKSDATCCVHAEMRAVLNALSKNGYDSSIEEYFERARIYFARLDARGLMAFSGEPYCTQCSKVAMDVGISEWCLWHKEGARIVMPDGSVETISEGVYVYDAREYNAISFNHHKSAVIQKTDP